MGTTLDWPMDADLLSREMPPPEKKPPPDVRLRAVEDDDVPVFFEFQRDPVAVEMAAFPGRDREAYYTHTARIRADPSVTFRTILVDGRVAGNIVAWDDVDQRAVGYWLGREFWGRGVATQALAAFLEIEPTRPLYAHVAKHNTGSIRVLEKCGFTLAGERGPEPDDEVEELLLRLR
jgi:RimJ/RimL family protein N-acetyltransferase